jgi:hypothetical protein
VLTDILERLREEQLRCSANSLDCGCAYCGRSANLVMDAENAIEKLVQALDGMLKYGHPDWPECKTARSALKAVRGK